MSKEQTFSEEEQKRRDELLLKLLKTPPKPRDKHKKEGDGDKPRRPKRK